MEYVMVIV
jgi:hypothetical protein